MNIAIFAMGMLVSLLSWTFTIPLLVGGDKKTLKRLLPVTLGATAFTIGWAIYCG